MSYKYDTGGGFSGQSYDKHVFEENLSTVNKLQREYWTAKQVLKKKFGKEQDQHVIASDSEIDAKLRLFKSIQTTCAELIKEIDNYQQEICNLSRDESSLGRFLKDQGAADKTQAGKMMIAVGKSLCYTAQQRLNLRNPLGRLHQDVETFRYRAISDSLMSVDQMEEARTHYRASLLWMQDISENLDPEQYKKLEKFRKVQNEVRVNREKFDRQKWAVCQKVDLLCASRSNLFSNTLVPYQEESLKFWDKTARASSAVLESFKGYHHYEFKLLKSLNPIQDIDLPTKEGKSEEEGADQNADSLINFEDFINEEEDNDVADAVEALDINKEDMEETKDNQASTTATSGDLMGETGENRQTSDDLDLLNDILGNNDNPEQDRSDLEKQWQSVFGDFEDQSPSISNEDLLKQPTDAANVTTGSYMPSQLMDFNFLSGTQPQQYGMVPQGGMMMGAGQMPQMQGQMMGGQFPQPPAYNALYNQNMGPGIPQQTNIPGNDMSAPNKSDAKSTWYNLFAELDPLQNPDELGGKNDTNKKEKQAC